MKRVISNHKKQLVCFALCIVCLCGCKKVDRVINPIGEDLVAITLSFISHVSDTNYKGERVAITSESAMELFCNKLRDAKEDKGSPIAPLIWECLLELKYLNKSYYGVIYKREKTGTFLRIYSNKSWGIFLESYNVNALGEFIEELVAIETIDIRGK